VAGLRVVYKLVKIEWADAVVRFTESTDELTDAIAVGILKSQTKDAVAIAVGYWPETDEWEGVLIIPRKTIKKITVLEEV
jgi:hypothetical protein